MNAPTRGKKKIEQWKLLIFISDVSRLADMSQRKRLNIIFAVTFLHIPEEWRLWRFQLAVGFAKPGYSVRALAAIRVEALRPGYSFGQPKSAEKVL